ncbi:MAG: CDP-diacylglycerol-glycerol-3-phosphate 3-phosphatidyltransferase [candidate division TM6 bacterium GW2011_GWF2_32_72]|nr:MAG: CDP-diacylglycerol-glycerol-3-phosphate 3-phosphatidyltransferase [candidate division TM6 bacterium GW2011_GWF2_32_72]
MDISKNLNIVNRLTLIRLIFLPILFSFLCVLLLRFDVFFLNVLLAVIFLVFTFTDKLNDYLFKNLLEDFAPDRRLNPLSDKLFVFGALMGVLAAGKLSFVWALLFVGRDIFVLGLKVIKAGYDGGFPSLFVSKVKRILLWIALTLVILNPGDDVFDISSSTWNFLEFVFLLAALITSLYSAYCYYLILIKEMNEQITKEIEVDIDL